jgi:hypothetical protein
MPRFRRIITRRLVALHIVMSAMPTATRRCRSFYSIMVVVLCVVGSGCATTSQYQSRASSPVDGAIVRGTHEFHWNYWYKLGVDQVDGKTVNLSWWSDWAKPVLIDPGDRVIKAKCIFALGGSRTDEVTVDLTVRLQVGHNYQLRNGIEGHVVVFWVEDMKTHLQAGKKVTVNTTPSSPSETAAETAAGLLLRVLLLIGTGQ